MTNTREEEEDINEAFEKLLFAEEKAEEVGYVEGYEAGRNQLIKGYHLGYHRASILAAKLGYFYGIIEFGLSNFLFSDKIIQQAIKLRDDLINFPKDNDVNIDILKTVEDIKFKFNKLCSLAKIDSFYPEVERLNY